MVRQPAAHVVEPRPPVGIVQRDAGGHLGDVGRRVQVIALTERPAETFGKGQSDRGLPRPGHAHHDEVGAHP